MGDNLSKVPIGELDGLTITDTRTGNSMTFGEQSNDTTSAPVAEPSVKIEDEMPELITKKDDGEKGEQSEIDKLISEHNAMVDEVLKKEVYAIRQKEARSSVIALEEEPQTVDKLNINGKEWLYIVDTNGFGTLLPVESIKRVGVHANNLEPQTWVYVDEPEGIQRFHGISIADKILFAMKGPCYQPLSSIVTPGQYLMAKRKEAKAAEKPKPKRVCICGQCKVDLTEPSAVSDEAIAAVRRKFDEKYADASVNDLVKVAMSTKDRLAELAATDPNDQRVKLAQNMIAQIDEYVAKNKSEEPPATGRVPMPKNEEEDLRQRLSEIGLETVDVVVVDESGDEDEEGELLDDESPDCSESDEDAEPYEGDSITVADWEAIMEENDE